MNTNGHIFIRPKISDQALKDFSHDFFRWVHIPRFEERVSNVNQSQDLSYFGSASGIDFEVSENPKRLFLKGRCLEDYPFLVSLAPEGTNQSGDYLVQHAHILAWRLSRDGFRCFVPNNYSTVSNEQEGMVYNA